MCALLLLRFSIRSPAWLGGIVSTTRSAGAAMQVSPAGKRQLSAAPALRSTSQASAALPRSCERSASAAPAAMLLAGAGGTVAGRRRWRRASSRTAAGKDDSETSPSDSSAAPSKAASIPASGGASTAAPRQDKNFLEKMKEKLDKNPELQEDLKTFFTSLSIALCIRGLLVEPRFIPSLSMYPNFDVGDQLTVDKISKRWRDFQRRDVVVFNPPQSFYNYVGGDRSGEALIKRIVALAGDKVEVKNGGTLYVNGEAQDEPFTNEAARYDYGPVTVPEGCVLVLGDNRNQSLDGHVWGFLPVENIIGRATFKFWPPWHVGTVPAAPS
eukprot:TRINITY_DN32950_c0_g1_i1.p1 TRINITY_DN32950_c0_g1~~TRINITY_DN32950_c0_g1_i1.p1  ORF type:complete len:368 (-),score=57.09 TRINITY_DN32950_c0_g1_i1:56-1036(-)